VTQLVYALYDRDGSGDAASAGGMGIDGTHTAKSSTAHLATAAIHHIVFPFNPGGEGGETFVLAIQEKRYEQSKAKRSTSQGCGVHGTGCVQRDSKETRWQLHSKSVRRN
jgi:hypothetical protein